MAYTILFAGKFYILNGEKKWITNGVFADYFTVAVRTGGPGADGISLLLVERGPGVVTKQVRIARTCRFKQPRSV